MVGSVEIGGCDYRLRSLLELAALGKLEELTRFRRQALPSRARMRVDRRRRRKLRATVALLVADVEPRVVGALSIEEQLGVVEAWLAATADELAGLEAVAA